MPVLALNLLSYRPTPLHRLSKGCPLGLSPGTDRAVQLCTAAESLKPGRSTPRTVSTEAKWPLANFLRVTLRQVTCQMHGVKSQYGIKIFTVSGSHLISRDQTGLAQEYRAWWHSRGLSRVPHRDQKLGFPQPRNSTSRPVDSGRSPAGDLN